MELSIASCATEIQNTPQGKVFDPAAGVRQAAEAGFRYVDFNFAQAAKDHRPLSQDRWQDWAKEMRDACDAAGVTVTQTHGYWFYIEDEASPQVEWNMEMLRRSIIASSYMGDHPWTVVHPLSLLSGGEYSERRTLDFMVRHMCELGELAAKYGVRIAMENTFKGGLRYFGCTAEELVWLMETLHDPIFGVCWDFGHANRAKLDHVAALRLIAPYLAVTHVHDNKGVSDDHFFPYFGNVPWSEILPEITRLGYDGNWNFEVHTTYQTLPQQLRGQSLRFLREIGEDMLRQMKGDPEI